MSDTVIRIAPHTDAMKAFLEAYRAGTEPFPLAENFRTWRNRAALEVSLFDGAVLLSAIQTVQQGNGFGSEALDWLVALAREHDVQIRGDVVRFGGKGGMSLAQLRLWYRRHGFSVDNRDRMYWPSRHGGAGRGQGRKPLSPDSDTVSVSVKMTQSQVDKLDALGGARWLRRQLEQAQVRPDVQAN